MTDDTKDSRIIAEVQPRRGSKPQCSGCGKRSAGYDRMPTPRLFEFIAIFNIPVFLQYTMRRVDCPDCGVTVEQVPWAQGKHTCCDVFRHFLATWAKRMSWKETAECFHVKWDTVRRSVQWVVAYGLKNRSLEGIEALGVDEVAIVMSNGQNDPVYAYRFDWDELPTIAGTDMQELMGAAHASEIPFVFGMFDDSFMSKLMFDENNIPGRDVLSKSMSSYWAEFAYSSTPGRGRSGTLPEWRAWSNESAEGDKYIIFDDEKDHGIRMTNKATTLAVLHQRLLSDTRFPDADSHSQMYDCLLKDTRYWNLEEFEALGGSPCENRMFSSLL